MVHVFFGYSHHCFGNRGKRRQCVHHSFLISAIPRKFIPIEHKFRDIRIYCVMSTEEYILDEVWLGIWMDQNMMVC